jgi:ribonucleotide reductase class II
MLNEVYAPSAKPVFYRTYSREKKENWQDVCNRTVNALISLGKLTKSQGELIRRSQKEFKVLSSGRWLWCGGTDWLKKPENVYGAYNCSSTNIDGWEALALMMNLAMQGCGTGAVLEDKYIKNLPVIKNFLDVEIVNLPGSLKPENRHEETVVSGGNSQVNIFVGDSRKGWVDSYRAFLKLSSSLIVAKNVKVFVCLGAVRNSGEKLKGFGGTANPIALAGMYEKLARILNNAIGRQLTALELCKLIDEASVVVVAGNVRRSAGMRQGSPEDIEFATAKDELWQQDSNGQWKIDPDKDCLRMSNHTLVYHSRPTLEEVRKSIQKQFHSGEGAIQWAGEAVARANVDLLHNKDLKNKFLDLYDKSLDEALIFLIELGDLSFAKAEERMSRYATNPCGEILFNNNFCNLSEVHLNTLDGKDLNGLRDAFKSAGLIASVLLNDKFPDERYQKSRELDPIVGVSFTGLFDFFVNLFGESWLRWWEAGRPTETFNSFITITGEDLDNWGDDFPPEVFRIMEDWALSNDVFDGVLFKEIEQFYLTLFKDAAHKAVWEYCDTHNLKRPNRCTTVQPSGTKALLTGASPGWHPPKAARFIRRITFGRDDAVALACMDYGYSIIPSQSCKDSEGNLLDDPFHPLCTEWLVEIPTKTVWADNIANEVDISKFSVKAQFDFYLQVQNYYTTHNTSATLEIRQEEIEEYSQILYQNIQSCGGYSSAALLARFDGGETFPRLPFEPISKEKYEELWGQVLSRRVEGKSFDELLQLRLGNVVVEDSQVGPAGCDSDKCLFTLPAS